MKAMILAAGLGQRMRPLTDHLPKPLLLAGKKPLLQYHFEALRAAGIFDVIINLAYLGDKIRDFAGDGSHFGLHVTYSEEPEPLETGGAILHALPLLGAEPFLLINADVWCDMDLQKFAARPLHQQLGHLLLVPNPEFHRLGDFALNESGYLLQDVEKSHPKRFTFAGISLLKPELVSGYPNQRYKFPLVEAFRFAIASGQLSAEVHHGYWSDVGTPERLEMLNSYLASQGAINNKSN